MGGLFSSNARIVPIDDVKAALKPKMSHLTRVYNQIKRSDSVTTVHIVSTYSNSHRRRWKSNEFLMHR